MQGIVFNSHYYTWMDLAHQELIREVLGPLDVLHSLGADVVVAESSARYFASARFDEEIDIEVSLDSLTTSSMTTVHTFRRGETVLAEGRVRHVAVDPKALTKTPGQMRFAPPSPLFSTPTHSRSSGSHRRRGTPSRATDFLRNTFDSGSPKGTVRPAERGPPVGRAQSTPGTMRRSRTAPSPRAAIAS